MCNRCVAVEVISTDGALTHVGYDESDADKYEKLLEGDIVLEAGGKKRRLSQEDYLTLWESLREKEGYGVIDPNRPQEGNAACAICSSYLVTVPGIDAQCEGCESTKHGTINHISENREEIKRDMEEFFGQEGAGHGKRNDPIELAMRAGLQCPNGHWVCSDCLEFRREEL